jgi:hypothetical protein
MSEIETKCLCGYVFPELVVRFAAFTIPPEYLEIEATCPACDTVFTRRLHRSVSAATTKMLPS